MDENNNSAISTSEKLAARQNEFDEFMGHFSTLFGDELAELGQLDASHDAIRLLADCIEANWIVFDRVGGDIASKESLASLRAKLHPVQEDAE